MTEAYFTGVERIRYEGPDSDTPLAYRWYDPDRMVLGRRMADHLRVAVCYWHSFCWPGSDPFGGGTLDRPWMRAGDPVALAEAKMDVAFELFGKLGVPFFTFHDRDVAPEMGSLRETQATFARLTERLQGCIERSGVKLLWGTANLFSHPRYMAGAATNPDPEVFACAAAQVRDALEATHRLGGVNYVLWGGREGYDTLLNTDMARELDQLGRFLTMVVEHKHKIGFTGTILIEPKPMEPTKHQYDHDVATVYGFLKRYGLEKEVAVNIEVNHATLAGHSFEHEVATALALGVFGSIDMNRGDPQNGWDTDQFPNDHVELALPMARILESGGFTTGGFNFDAKIRRQSVEPDDLLHAHVGGIDTLARALLAGARLVEDGRLRSLRAERYAGWKGDLGQKLLGGLDLAGAADAGLGFDPRPRSGRQEMLENLVNRLV
ncbi:xylose isomerase (plasmid) [Azospirillum baldaniorum]|uniref:Xylose isomerase n=1 Tax=Azospirillum baldaniorum TaxID=1064539 RepID=A0A9P1NRJ2_9PROT|nr:xylose isomerase [Azospirillum baldaniorum]AWJ92778.1 xylose isomerase [Azospirillum baldaniorum]TWA78193.1 D-xylose isomerase [Azospirillum brasilense]CCD02685.1 D-xylose isomerase [Azospirillum baldaniorum]